MKRTLIITAVILALITAGAVLSFMYTEKTIEKFSADLKNTGSNYEELRKIRTQWDEKKTVLMLFMNHRDIEDVSIALIRAESQSKNGRDGMALQEIELAVFLMEELVEREKFSIENIL